MPPRAPRDLPRLELRDHGLLTEDQLAVAEVDGVAPVLDLAHGGNRYGPPSSVREAMRSAPLDVHPDPQALRARSLIARALDTRADTLVLGNGTFDLLWSCGRALLRPGAAVLSVMPGHGEFAAAARASGARVVQWRAVERTGHAVDLEQVAGLIRLESPALVQLSAPALPTGARVSFEDVARLAAASPECLFLVDQSELALSEQHADALLPPPANVLCIRSISQELGLFGVPVALLWASPELCREVERRRPSFNTSTVAQAIAVAWVAEQAFIAASRARLLEDRARLSSTLAQLGLTPTPSVSPSLVVRMARAGEVSEELLSTHRVAVRDCSAYGLPDHLRISGVPAGFEAQLRAALAAVLARRGLNQGRET